MGMITCPVCHADVYAKPIMEFISSYNHKEYHLQHCKKCDLEFWWPLELISEFYESGFMEEEYKNIHDDEKGLESNMMLFLENIPCKKGVLLDIGCGNGGFLKAAEKKGFEVVGVDLDSKNVENCRRKGLNVYKATLTELVEKHPEFNQRFDAITFFEVLEHQDNPRGFIDNVRQLLQPGGYIGLSVPNRQRITIYGIGFLSRVVPSEKIHSLSRIDFPPHHLTRWSRMVLGKFLYENGFEDVKTIPITLNYKSRVSYWNTVLYKLATFRGIRFAKNSDILKIIAFPLGISPFGLTVSMYGQGRLKVK
jgi:2-polyprenyl-3-methyl-5-hydroxy-6-metoxy-1,4-benzoquinol methylase